MDKLARQLEIHLYREADNWCILRRDQTSKSQWDVHLSSASTDKLRPQISAFASPLDLSDDPRSGIFTVSTSEVRCPESRTVGPVVEMLSLSLELRYRQ